MTAKPTEARVRGGAVAADALAGQQGRPQPSKGSTSRSFTTTRRFTERHQLNQIFGGSFRVTPPVVHQTIPQSPPLGSPRRRPGCPPRAPAPAAPFRHRSETLDPVAPSSNPDPAEISAALFVQHVEEAWAQGAHAGNHCRGRRHEAAESDVGLSPDRATDRLGLRHSPQQGRRASHPRRSSAGS